MNREHRHFPPPQQHVRYPQPNHHYNDYGIHTQPDPNKSSSQSDLVIFNGQTSERELYLSNSKLHNGASGAVKVQKSVSQKKLPIVYSSNSESSYQVGPPSRQLASSKSRDALHAFKHEDNIESNHSEVYQYAQMFPQTAGENQVDANGFQTFKCIPPDNNPQTAHFIPEEGSHIEERKAREDQILRQRQKVSARGQPIHYLSLPGQQDVHQGHHTYQQIQSNTRPMSRGAPPLSKPPSPPPPIMKPPLSPRSNYQNSRQISVQSSGGPNLIKIPQEQYQKFIDHLPKCKQTQDQIALLKNKNGELREKEHFYWEENMTLRQENKRLRDLVTHFEKREKELVKSRDHFKQSHQQLINNYKESALQQMTLLFQRYRLELQK